MALSWTPGSFTFLSCSFAISEVFGCNGMIQGSLIRSGLISLQTKFIAVPTIVLSCDSTQILPDQQEINADYYPCQVVAKFIVYSEMC